MNKRVERFEGKYVGKYEKYRNSMLGLMAITELRIELRDNRALRARVDDHARRLTATESEKRPQ